MPDAPGPAWTASGGISAQSSSCRSTKRIIRKSSASTDRGSMNTLKSPRRWLSPHRWHRASALLMLVAAIPTLYFSAHAQMRVRPVDLEDGDVALGLVLRHLNNTGVFMQATAHPDDESNALHVYLNRGQGVRTVLATATRGDGGQNEIGPEIFDALAVLRTEELAALHRFDATEQYFTRAVDFGFSFSIEETMQKWGRDEILGDYVRLIRMTRPDVMLGMSPVANSGGFHHNSSGILSREAFKIAGDPTKYPEQIQQGLRPWQPKKYYYPGGGFGPAGAGAAGGAGGAAGARGAGGGGRGRGAVPPAQIDLAGQPPLNPVKNAV